MVLDEYLQWYESVGRRLVLDPGEVSTEEKARFIQVGGALTTMVRGLNVAVGNYETTSTTDAKKWRRWARTPA